MYRTVLTVLLYVSISAAVPRRPWDSAEEPYKQALGGQYQDSEHEDTPKIRLVRQIDTTPSEPEAETTEVPTETPEAVKPTTPETPEVVRTTIPYELEGRSVAPLAPSPRFYSKLSYFQKNEKERLLVNLLESKLGRRKFRSKCRCEKITNCPKLQMSVGRCPDELFLCCF